MKLKRLVKKSLQSVAWSLQTLRELFSGEITFKYARIKFWSQLTFVGKRFVDGVNWNSYHSHYAEELRMIEKTNTLLLGSKDLSMVKGRIHLISEKSKPLLATHKLLYETITKLKPRSVLEIGCGAGDHLFNMQILIPNLECHGVELLQRQLDSLKTRHPQNNFHLRLADLTSHNYEASKLELVFTQAVLMHITEKESRFQIALENVLNTAENHVVLMENWTQHDFFFEVQEWQKKNPGWKLYFDISDQDERIRVMIISKKDLSDYQLLTSYNQLLWSGQLEKH